jgi:hypothetical protein
MALPLNRQFDELAVHARTSSIGATPVAGTTVATKKGRITRAFAFSEGASSGTIAVAISINGGASGGSFSFSGGSNARGSGEFSIAVEEGDLIAFTPSGGAGAAIPGHFYAIVR